CLFALIWPISLRFEGAFFRISFPAPPDLSFFMRNSLLIFCNQFVLRIVLILKILRISAL
ncbi:hypothetical protein DKR19_23525, partial [Salmonella enterica]|nr:hypothetical protein [Salmonella enterica]